MLGIELSSWSENLELINIWRFSLLNEPTEFFEKENILHKDCSFYIILEEETTIGFFIIKKEKDENDGSFIVSCCNFYILPDHQPRYDSKDVFQELVVKSFSPSKAFLNSGNVFFMNVLLDIHQKIDVVGYSPFVLPLGKRYNRKVQKNIMDFNELRFANPEDESQMNELIAKDDGPHQYFISPKEVKEMIINKELFILTQKEQKLEKEIVGIGVLVKNQIFSEHWSIGMFVNPKYRKRGIGTYILQKLQEKCFQNGKGCCAGCAKGNVGSRKTLQRSGMVLKGSHLLVNLL